MSLASDGKEVCCPTEEYTVMAKRKSHWWRRLSASQKAATIEKIVAGKMADPRRKAKVDTQARVLIAERRAMFGDSWRDGCAIQIPKDFVEDDQ